MMRFPNYWVRREPLRAHTRNEWVVLLFFLPLWHPGRGGVGGTSQGSGSSCLHEKLWPCSDYTTLVLAYTIYVLVSPTNWTYNITHPARDDHNGASAARRQAKRYVVGLSHTHTPFSYLCIHLLLRMVYSSIPYLWRAITYNSTLLVDACFDTPCAKQQEDQRSQKTESPRGGRGATWQPWEKWTSTRR